MEAAMTQHEQRIETIFKWLLDHPRLSTYDRDMLRELKQEIEDLREWAPSGNGLI